MNKFFVLYVIFVGILVGLGIKTIEDRRQECYTDIECCEQHGDCDDE